MVAQGNDNQGAVLEQALTRFIDECLQGNRPAMDEFVKQYPQCEAQLKMRLQNFQEIDSLFSSLFRTDENEFDATATRFCLTGHKIKQFEICEMIGQGGMGVVYLARDTRLDRSVAIKSLPTKLQINPAGQTRFHREAKLLASLNHPNIAVIHEIIEQEEGTSYLVLEYVPGQTLAQRIAREPLKREEAFSIGQQIADAISAAHDKGVIHRDLKPGNIKITPEGKVKVLDFGLAKAFTKETRIVETDITQSGHIIGTPAYMSPEQACGKETDYRTDIWSFGCMMYEMLTGKLPFEADTATGTVARILECEPDWKVLPQDTPPSILTLLRRCLEKDPNRRPRDIGDAGIELRNLCATSATSTAISMATSARMKRLATVIGVIVVALTVFMTILARKLPDSARSDRIESLAVLPLRNLSNDPDQEFFADGLTDSLIAELGKVGALQVRSRTSIMQYKGVNKPLPEIGQQLNADVVVEGSILRLGQQVRITVQLIHAPTDTHLWADTYERDQRDIITLFSEIARTIADKIEITLTPDQEARLAATRPINPEAFGFYMRGMFHLHKETPEGTKMGLDYLHQAIERDPTHPLPYGALAIGYALSTHAPGAPPDAFERAKAAAANALNLDDNVAEAHAALAMIKVFRDWDWEGASREYHHALDLNPNLTMTRAQYSWYLLLFDRIDDALAQMRIVQETDPLIPLWPAWLGWQNLWAERYDDAIKEADKALELAPDFPVALYVKGCAYAGKEMYDKAIELHKKAGSLSPQWKCGLARTYALAGRLEEAQQALAEIEADYTLWDTWFIARIHIALGNKDQAFRWLETAYGPPNHPYLPWMKYAPDFKSLRDDPRFTDLLRRMNFPE